MHSPPLIPLSSSSPFTYLILLFDVFVVVSFTPCYGWLFCVGRMGSDTLGVIIASRIIIVVIIVSPPSRGAYNGDVQGRKRAWWQSPWCQHSSIAMLWKGRQSKREDVFMVLIIDDLSENSILPGGTVGYPAQPGSTWRNHRLPSPTRINLEES